MKKIRIARAGGGTGGHVFPIKSLIQYLQKAPSSQKEIDQMVRFGMANSLEQENCLELQKEIKNLKFISIASGKRRREKTISAFFKNIKDLFCFAFGVLQSLSHLQKEKIDVIFCKGGYVALPVVIAAKVLRRRIIVHESDVVPGVVNRIAARFAAQNFTGFPGVLPRGRVVGQILSDELLVDEGPLSKTKKTTQVLVMGGSQGSKNLYQAFAKTLKANTELGQINFTILLGKLNQEMQSVFSPFKNVKTIDFASQQEIGRLYQSADIAITRAGTTSLAEQSLFDLQLIMIPIPRTHDQKQNALWYVQHKNGILIDQDDPDFEVTLAKILKEHMGFKKKPSKKDKKTEIEFAKKLIVQSILG